MEVTRSYQQKEDISPSFSNLLIRIRDEARFQTLSEEKDYQKDI